MTPTLSQNKTTYRLWLTTEMYIPLDEDGYVQCDVPCLEGSMGYVIQAMNRDDNEVRYAWKIHRLLGDSLTENQYVCQLLSTEAKHAIRMQRSPAVLAGLGHAGNPFERPVPGIWRAEIAPHRSTVARHYILVQFQKGKRPRFCSVTFESTIPRFTPEVEPLRIHGTPGGDNLQKSIEEKVYAQYIQNATTKPGRPSVIVALLDSYDSEQRMDGWYFKLPSVLYDWAGGTLQEAISAGARTNDDGRTPWTPQQNLVLITRILTGIRELHTKQLLHGDLRPANIMYVRDPADPEDYVLTDYGSLASGDADRFDESGVVANDDRTLFQSITNPRSSQFYAPERRHGYEHEEGDLVLLVPILTTGLKAPNEPLSTTALRGWVLIVGWRNALDTLRVAMPDATGSEVPVPRRRSGASPSAPGGGKAPPKRPERSRPSLEDSALGALIKSVADELAGGAPRAGVASVDREMRLHPGDRIRLREYVFRVRSISERPIAFKYEDGVSHSTTLTIIYCDPEFWKVFTERLIVVINDAATEFPLTGRSFEELSVPKIVELYRWSQATDIFAVGALSLYSMFPRNTGRSAREIEQDFSSLLEVLENPAFFRKIWPDLDFTCLKLQEALETERSLEHPPKDFPSYEVKVSRGTLSSPQHISEPRTIKELAKDTVGSLAQTAPHAYDIFQQTFQGNVAHFCMFMRFVLACLHRQTSCPPEWGANDVRLPYCASRIESTAVQFAVDKALGDIRALLPFLTDERLLSLTLSEEERTKIPQFVDQGKTETLMLNMKLMKDLKAEHEAGDRYRQSAERLQNELDRVQDQLGRQIHTLLDELQHQERQSGHVEKLLLGALGRRSPTPWGYADVTATLKEALRQVREKLARKAPGVTSQADADP